MKRRAFLSNLAAAATLPLLPASASIALPSSAAQQHFALAKLLTRAHNHCTRDMLQRLLKVSPELARDIQLLLLERGVITTPVAGASMAVNPINTNCVPNEALKSTNMVQKLAQARAKVKDVLEHIPQDKAEPAPPEDVEEADETTPDPNGAIPPA